jgi:hypothetical protein
MSFLVTGGDLEFERLVVLHLSHLLRQDVLPVRLSTPDVIVFGSENVSITLV